MPSVIHMDGIISQQTIAVMERGKTMRTSNKEVIIKRIYGDKNQEVYEEVAEVVRCKDCMWGNNKTRSGKRYCELSDMYQVDDGFCNWGEKIK